MIQYLFLWCCIPFFVAAAFHLSSCLAGKERYADISKVIIMPLLIAGIAAFYVIRFKTGEAGGSIIPVILVCAALAAGNAGDVFLLGDVKPAALAKGLSSFLAGHIIYIAILLFYVPFVLSVPPLFTVISVAVYAAAVYLSRFLAGKPRGILGAGVIVYAAILGTFSLLALLHLAGLMYAQKDRELIGALVKLYTGTLLFIASDGILSRTIFVKPFFQSRFAVMSTYIGAQFCIAWGFCSIF